MKSKLIKKKPLPLFLMSIKSEIRLDPLPGAIIWVESLLRPQLIRYFKSLHYCCIKLGNYLIEYSVIHISSNRAKKTNTA